MKQQKLFFFKLASLLTFLLFLSCNDDLYNNHEHNHGENKNKISFFQFKKETKIEDFKTIIKSNVNAMKSTNRTAELSDFVIDTLAIQRHISQNNKTTYSFRIYPLSNVALPNESFNLVYRLENNNWEQSIFLIKTNSNLEFSEINHLYDSFLEVNTTSQRGYTACISTTPVTFCTGQSACADRCDATTSGGCPTGECYRYVITTIGDCSTGGGGSSDPNNGNPSDNSQSGYIPTNPYEFTPNMFDNPVYDDPNYVNAIKAQHFFSNLLFAQQVWANENVDAYNLLIQYQIDNNWSDESETFVEELMDLEINGNLLSFFPSFKYPAGSNYSTLYPNFTILVKEYIPLLKNDQRLLNTINRLTGVSISTIKQDLTWGNGPEINITQLGLDPSGNPYYGKFNILEPNKIYIDIDLVQQIEALSNIPNPTPQQNQQIGFLNALITFSVCLHEYVHYSDFAFDGTMQDNENLELGLLFEEIYLGGYYEFNPNGNVIFIKAN